MTEHDQVAALAELDGWTCDVTQGLWTDVDGGQFVEHSLAHHKLPNYLTSYDAIIPLIQRQPRKIIVAMEDHFEEHMKDWLWLKLTPSQLTEALLRATGKWKE
jgi:hypothetical protein